ncbi:E3 ubiquitin-protein ligase Hakai-like isoform X4 [Olea europaea var. sylvestris]|uniref:E3 ubiquitin-protein ligase Hakai-like isoform X4 n=1 Tax=Olea europaea var. sylvestris TaxID=158386 RepID=UPI000C1CDB39|nr:E3 ubiquitin-protein ligase Hakai-like isoform X4 [Olea europaea var. sylvestris]
MLQIRLSKPSSEGVGVAKPLPAETVTVACPQHLVLANLPVAKGLGSASATSIIKTAGRRSRRQPGERTHFCVRCDFPIAIYGRLSPCEHAFCLDCARSDSLCYLCDERIQKIQTIKLMEGIFICAATRCFKSFVETSEFLSHLKENHVEDLPPNTEKEGNKLEAISARKSSASDSTVQAPPKPVVYPNSNSHVHDREHEDQHPQSRDHPSPGVGPQNQYPQQAFDSQAVLQQDSVPIDPNPVIASSQFGYAPSVLDGTQQFYGTPYDMARPVSTPEVRPEHGSLLGFPPGPAGALNPEQNYPRPWSMGPAADGFMNASDPQGIAFFQGGYGRNMGILPSNPPPPSAINGVEQRQTGNFIDPRDCNRILPPQPLPPPASSHFQQGRPYYGTGSHDAPPGFESGQD